MKGRRLLAILLAIVMVFGMIQLPVGVSEVNAEGDVTAPTIDRITFTGGNYAKADEIKLSIEVTEAETGIDHLGINFYACTGEG